MMHGNQNRKDIRTATAQLALNKADGMKRNHSKRQELGDIENTNKYPTIKSIQVYECYVADKQQRFIKDSQEKEGSETSLKVEEEQEGAFKKMGLIEASDQQLAQGLSEELSLHYDYAWLVQESDHSLSMNVQF